MPAADRSLLSQRWPTGAWPGSHWPGSPAGPPSATSTSSSTPGSTSPAGRAWNWPGAPPPACPTTARAIDLCTGSGAVAVALRAARPAARDRGDGQRCPRRGLRPGQRGRGRCGAISSTPCRRRCGRLTDVVVAVVPYVPSPELHLLPRDTLEFEDASHYDGGPDGTDAAAAGRPGAPGFLRPGGGAAAGAGRGPGRPAPPHARAPRVRRGRTWSDEDGDLRGLEATFG